VSRRVADLVGHRLVELGVRQVFGVVGSGNFHVTNAMVAAGANYVAARHEGGAATMADAFGRVSGSVAALSLHQGCGLTNAITGVTEAAKSRTPLLILAAETAAGATNSNFRIDQSALARAVGAVPMRVTGPATAVAETDAAFRTAFHERRTVVLNLPLDVQAAEVAGEVGTAGTEPGAGDARGTGRQSSPAQGGVVPSRAGPSPQAVTQLTEYLLASERPVLIAGRGARGAGPQLRALGEASGALLATSAVAKGLFRGDSWDLDISGGFSTPVAAELIAGADLVVAFGSVLNMWTTRHGRLLSPDAVLVQVDLESSALASQRPIDLGVVGDSALTAEAVTERLAHVGGPTSARYRTGDVAARLAGGRAWRDVPYDDWGGDGRIDPRTLTIALDDLLPADRVVSVDSGNFMGYPSMFLDVPDHHGFCFTQAFQSVGLGLATGIGAALARPHRLPVVASGDGGLLMAASELETVVRLGIPMVVVVYDDGGYGAEIHHFGRDAMLDTVTFPPTDHAAIARGFGYEAVTIRAVDDLEAVARWVAGSRDRPLLIDAKVAGLRGSWWLEEAFRGH
jgi:acetolactate synthase I/II/III large subunit